MSKPSMTILVIGATGSIGSLVVEEALLKGHSVRALVRSPEKGVGCLRTRKPLSPI
jgi:uncharacterized protein YbjT (DUF2867 family)